MCIKRIGKFASLKTFSYLCLLFSRRAPALDNRVAQTDRSALIEATDVSALPTTTSRLRRGPRKEGAKRRKLTN